MSIVSLLILSPLLIYAWAVVYPLQAAAIVADLKRRWRRYLIRRKGEEAAAEIVHVFRVQAQNLGFQEEQIEEVIRDNWPGLVEKLGTRETNASLGEPTALERYF